MNTSPSDCVGIDGRDLRKSSIFSGLLATIDELRASGPEPIGMRDRLRAFNEELAAVQERPDGFGHPEKAAAARMVSACFAALEDLEFWSDLSGKISRDTWVLEAGAEKIFETLQDRKERYTWKGYETSFTNPRHAVEILGKSAGILFSGLYNALINRHFSAIRQQTETFVLSRQAVLELIDTLGAYLSGAAPEFDIVVDGVEKSLRRVFQDNTRIGGTDAIRNLVPEYNRQIRLLEKFDSLGERILWCRPWKYHAEALEVMRSLLDVEPELLRVTARELVAGFKRAVSNAGLELNPGDIVNFHFCEGMEPLVCRIIDELRCADVRVVLTCSPAVRDNHQENYDHRNDHHMALTPDFIEEYAVLMDSVYGEHAPDLSAIKGNMMCEFFGEDLYNPEQHGVCLPFVADAQKAFHDRLVSVTVKYMPPGRQSFTVCALPHPHLGPDTPELLRKSLGLLTLPLDVWGPAQERLIETLDRADRVRIVGTRGSRSDMTVTFRNPDDPAKQTVFANVLADLNFPVGEVFTTPALKGTDGTLHIPGTLFFAGLPYKEFTLVYRDGRIADYGCSNFDDPARGRQYIEENLFRKRESLPMGEFAIGTNRILDRMVRDHSIPSQKLSVLLIEKMGPHFAFGDTCFLMREDQDCINPDGRDVVARYNEISEPAEGRTPADRYFFVHVDVTLPYEYTGTIKAHMRDSGEPGEWIDIFRDNEFVLPGMEALNAETLDDPRLGRGLGADRAIF